MAARKISPAEYAAIIEARGFLEVLSLPTPHLPGIKVSKAVRVRAQDLLRSFPDPHVLARFLRHDPEAHLRDLKAPPKLLLRPGLSMLPHTARR